ncbi:Pentatricopeptide repeat [Macleaya cordata]|uniref:Pentatricopeptide repeat n=1 Tax=Macleaya cordata TaxID=56857 RepID=A0A200R237_MACCD|nr:Pentatricopeptide repeat [Macleaya cordata]
MAKNVSRLISYGASAASRRLSTATAATTTASIKDGENSLYRRLSFLGGTDKNVADTLNEWVKEGKPIGKTEAIGCVTQLRKYKKYKHAIQIMDWLENRDRDLAQADHAIRLDLIAKTEGIESAEKYFERLPEPAKNKLTYGALLYCYCQNKMTEKALALFEKMTDLNLVSSYLPYNNLMSLYTRVGEPEKVPPLVQKMKEKNIKPDPYTYTFLMNSYASLKDIEGVERTMEEMKKDKVKSDWSTYGTLASIYVKAGLFDKANPVLKELEKMDNVRDRKPYHILMGLYALANNKLGVNRVWESLKSAFPKTTNMSYVSLLHALNRLGDTDGLEKHFKEWESSCSDYDIRVANFLIESYLTRDMITEAELLREDAVKKGGDPNSRTLYTFMKFYLKKHQIDLALKYFVDAVSKSKDNKWEPSEETICTFRKYFEEGKDVDGAEKFFKSLKKVRSLDSEDYDSLLRTYIAAGKREPHMRQRMEADGIELSSGINKLLGRVCPA